MIIHMHQTPPMQIYTFSSQLKSKTRIYFRLQDKKMMFLGHTAISSAQLRTYHALRDQELDDFFGGLITVHFCCIDMDFWGFGASYGLSIPVKFLS